MKVSPWVLIGIALILLVTAGAYAYVSLSVGTEMEIAKDMTLLNETPYTNAKHSYSIYIPKEWTTDTSRSNYFIDAMFLDSKTDMDGKLIFRTNINVGAVPIKIAGVTSLEDCVTPEKLAKLFPNYTSTGDAIEMVNGVEARIFGGTFDTDGYHLRNRQLQLVENGLLYDVTATALASEWDAHADIIEASLRSLTIK